MTRNSYKNLLIESAVADIKKIEVFKTPADHILASANKGTVTDDVSKVRDAESAIAVLGRIYDAQDEDRPLIRENDEENEAQGDSEIEVDLPDHSSNAKIQDIADVIDDDAGCEVNPDQEDQFKSAVQDEANNNHLDESFILEDDEDLPEDELPEDEESDEDDSHSDSDEDEGVNEEDDELPEDELPEDDSDSDDEESNKVPEDEETPVEDDSEDTKEVDEEDDELPEDELPEDDSKEDDSEESDDEDDSDSENNVEDECSHEDVDDSTLDELEQTGDDELLAGDSDELPAEEIETDGDVYNEDVEDPTQDPNGDQGQVPHDTEAEDQTAEPVQPDTNADVNEDQDHASAEDPTKDPNADQGNEVPEEDKNDPVVDVDSQVVASDTTQESVMESLIRSLNESSDEGYMDYESDDFDSED